MYNVQKHNVCANVPSSQTCRSYFFRYLSHLCRFLSHPFFFSILPKILLLSFSKRITRNVPEMYPKYTQLTTFIFSDCSILLMNYTDRSEVIFSYQQHHSFSEVRRSLWLLETCTVLQFRLVDHTYREVSRGV
jgi:hypothetical protein